MIRPTLKSTKTADKFFDFVGASFENISKENDDLIGDFLQRFLNGGDDRTIQETKFFIHPCDLNARPLAEYKHRDAVKALRMLEGSTRLEIQAIHKIYLS